MRERSAPLVDAHHHFWDLSTGWYAWPTPAEAPIHRSFSAEDLAPELASAGIDATVIVQAIDSRMDTDAMRSVASRHPWIAGVVGWIPLADRPDAERALDREGDTLCGVRHLIHREADAEWLVRPAIQPGLSLLEERGIPFDVVAVFPDHLPLIPRVVKAHPDLRLVIDHLAKPPFRADGWDAWVAAIRAAAASPTVCCEGVGVGHGRRAGLDGR